MVGVTLQATSISWGYVIRSDRHIEAAVPRQDGACFHGKDKTRPALVGAGGRARSPGILTSYQSGFGHPAAVVELKLTNMGSGNVHSLHGLVPLVSTLVLSTLPFAAASTASTGFSSPPASVRPKFRYW